MLTRRDLLKTSGLAALGAATSGNAFATIAKPTLPDRENFRVQEFETCLNAGRWHPLSNGARAAVNRYHEYKQRGIWDRTSIETPNNPNMHGGSQPGARALFAKLINATPAEIAFVPSTTAGENLVVQSLGLPAPGKNIVTDGLHFEGSLYLYDALRKQGADIRVIKPHDWRVDLADFERVIDKNTVLVAVSLISFINGYQHDLKSLCKLAHERGALVYADVVQAAGAMPIDVRELGVDFCSTASYKWLQGDFGVGFLYANQELLKGRLTRPVHSYRQVTGYETHMFPGDPAGSNDISWTQIPTAAGHFETGTIASAVTETLAYSLNYIQTLGVDTIHKHSQAMIDQMRAEIPKLGHECITPTDAHGPLIAFLLKDPAAVEAKLKTANVDVTIAGNRMRVSPSVYNDASDIDRLLRALAS